eukprot:jgi/Ulvmu1/8337/UM042_0043.1
MPVHSLASVAQSIAVVVNTQQAITGDGKMQKILSQILIIKRSDSMRRLSRSTARRVHVLKRPASNRSHRQVVLYDLHDQVVTYESAWHWQKERAHAIASGTCTEEALLLLQHPPVYTLGTRSTLDNVKFDSEDPPHPIFRTERGGEVTYHGPGQLVMYPIIDLKLHGKDLHAYLRQLEDVIMDALAEVSGIDAYRESGLTGVWVSTGKIAAIGVRATRWVTYHGAALNVCVDLAPFDDIIPCGIQDRDVSSVTKHSSAVGVSCDQSQKDLMGAYSRALVQAFKAAFSLSFTSVRRDLDASMS